MINVKGNIVEHRSVVQDEYGYRLEEHRVQMDQIGLKWGSYLSREERMLSFSPEKTTVVSHFRLSDEPPAGRFFAKKQFVVYREPAMTYEIPVTPTDDRPRNFFELAFPEDFFDELVTEESMFLTAFQRHSSVETPYYDFMAPTSPAMREIIREMQQAPYNGQLKAIYLEAKAMELFLLQIRELDRGNGGPQQMRASGANNLSAADIERLSFVRELLTTQPDEHWSIALLARKAGINQMKLKSGFKALFGATVFGCLTEIRMQTARRLLLDEKLFVGEVAERMGYKHAHHFTAAFSKKFGVLPSELRK